MITTEALLNSLKAAGEPTRLRLMCLCAQGELSVSEITEIVGQSQPRVSRHLKMLVDAGFLDRFREGAMVFYRLSEQGELGEFAKSIVNKVPLDDPELVRDKQRLDQVKRNRAERAKKYFSENADRWNEIRSLHVQEDAVEAALLTAIGSENIGDFLDIGTGTGRILVLVAGQIAHGIGLDISQEMLTVARNSFEEQGIKNVLARKGDMYNMPIDDACMDVATLHQVMHYCIDPERAIKEASRVLKPGGRLFIVDFSSHHEEQLRDIHQHFRLGFSDEEVFTWLSENKLSVGATSTLEGEPLTVKIWQGQKS